MSFFEMQDQEGRIRACYAEVNRWIEETGVQGLHTRLDEAERLLLRHDLGLVRELIKRAKAAARSGRRR